MKHVILRIVDEITSPFLEKQCHCEESATKPSREAGAIHVTPGLLRRGLLAMTVWGKLFRS